MGCVGGVEAKAPAASARRKKWSNGPSHSLEAFGLDQGKLEDLESSFDAWSWHLQEGQPGPPSRQLHEKHLKSLDRFLMKMDQKPSALEAKVMMKRFNGCREKDPMIMIQL